MIKIDEKEDCCGCEACVQVCPTKAISKTVDEEGFFYPLVDVLKCINCGLCVKVCPVINQGIERIPLHSFAVKNRDIRLRENSSSGGVFIELARNTILKGGVVFGARFDSDWSVCHDCVFCIEEVGQFMGSKYLQSRIENSYVKTKMYLEEGRVVLFTGTPCQIAGLNLFLGKDYPNLFTIDFICHGVPSPLVWKLYLRDFFDNMFSKVFRLKNQITDISFRKKDKGWKNFSLQMGYNSCFGAKRKYTSSFTMNEFMAGFLSDLYLRPACHLCPAKSLKSNSDLQIADFWGIKNILPLFDDDRGVSLVMIGSLKGHLLFKEVSSSFISQEVDSKIAIGSNQSFCKSVSPHPLRKVFFDYIEKGMFPSRFIRRTLGLSLLSRICKRICFSLSIK
ncbi:Coenzyme F420 hydrogenase/dehydrogenase, beta subunit C-terminal domain [Porphyromonadaceae bacterium]